MKHMFPLTAITIFLDEKSEHKACYSGLLLLFGRGPLLTLLASGLLRCPAGIQLSSYALAPEVTAGPSAPITEIWSAGSTFFDCPDDRLALSPPLPPRRF